MNLRICSLAFWLFLLGCNSVGAEEAQKWRGFILDKQCVNSVRDEASADDFIQHHTKDCALMRNCRASGFGLYAGGKWFDLDKHGSDLALKILSESKKHSGFFVEVRGDLRGKVLKVQSIREVEQEKSE